MTKQFGYDAGLYGFTLSVPSGNLYYDHENKAMHFRSKPSGSTPGALEILSLDHTGLLELRSGTGQEILGLKDVILGALGHLNVNERYDVKQLLTALEGHLDAGS
jgi:hypothetical protein